MDLETLNLRLKLSDIDPALGAELSRKIEADAENDDTNGLDKNNLLFIYEQFLHFYSLQQYWTRRFR